MLFTTLSAILRGGWLLDGSWSQQHLPIVAQLLNGESVDFSLQKESAEITAALQINTKTYAVNRWTSLSDIPDGSYAVVNLVGPVVRYTEPCGAIGTEDISSLFVRLNNSPNIKGVVMKINSPGGEASGTSMLASAIKQMNKPVLAFVEDGMAASAAMWIAASCTEIYASNKQSMFGSIGAYTVLADFKDFFEQKGIKIHEIYAPQSTDKNKIVKDAFAGDYSGFQSYLGDLVDNFIADVKANRGSKLNLKAGDPFTGKIFNASESKKIGLIDGIKSFDQVIARMDDLVKQQKSNSKNSTFMAKKEYPNLARVAGQNEGVNTDAEGNVTLSAAEADTVETALKVASTHTADVTKLNQTVTDLTSKNETLTNDLATANAKIKELGGKAANDGTAIITGGADEGADGGKPVKKEHPYTSEARALFGGK